MKKKMNPKLRKAIITAATIILSFTTGLVTKSNPELGSMINAVINTIKI